MARNKHFPPGAGELWNDRLWMWRGWCQHCLHVHWKEWHHWWNMQSLPSQGPHQWSQVFRLTHLLNLQPNWLPHSSTLQQVHCEWIWPIEGRRQNHEWSLPEGTSGLFHLCWAAAGWLQGGHIHLQWHWKVDSQPLGVHCRLGHHRTGRKVLEHPQQLGHLLGRKGLFQVEEGGERNTHWRRVLVCCACRHLVHSLHYTTTTHFRLVHSLHWTTIIITQHWHFRLAQLQWLQHVVLEQEPTITSLLPVITGSRCHFSPGWPHQHCPKVYYFPKHGPLSSSAPQLWTRQLWLGRQHNGHFQVRYASGVQWRHLLKLHG